MASGLLASLIGLAALLAVASALQITVDPTVYTLQVQPEHLRLHRMDGARYPSHPHDGHRRPVEHRQHAVD